MSIYNFTECDTTFSPIYHLDETGLYVGKGGSYIGNYIKLIGVTDINDVHTHLLEFISIKGYLARIAIEAGLIHDPKLGKLLGNAGYPFRPKHRKELIDYLASSHTKEQIQAVHQIGWHDKSFVLPHKIITSSLTKKASIQYYGSLPHNYFEASGSLEDWQKKVAALCAASDITKLALYAGFGAAISKFVNFSCGFHLAGPSSIGKTTLLKVALSIFCNPNTSLKKWNATQNGLEMLGYSFNNTLCAIDEINDIAKDNIPNLYTLVDGVGKTRAIASSGVVKMAAQNRWNTLILSSGEQKIEEMFLQHGKRIKAGESLRIIDIQVDHICSKEIIDQLQENIQQYYGTASIAFLQYFIDRVLISKEETEGELDFEFISIKERFRVVKDFLHKKYHTHSQGYRVLNYFALVILAAEIAIEAGVLNKDLFNPREDLEGVIRRWIADNENQKEHNQILTQFYKAIAEKHNHFADMDDPKFAKPNMIGFYKNNECYLIPISTNEKMWVKNGINPNMAWEVLEKMGLIEKRVSVRYQGLPRKWIKILPKAFETEEHKK